MSDELPDWIAQRRPSIARLAAKFGVASLTLFGSAARGDFDAARSDVDLLVVFLPMSPHQHADAYFGLLAALEDLFGRPVDLLEEPAIRNPYLLRSIDAERRTLYAA
jgi:predicted nucleotidyltransferase